MRAPLLVSIIFLAWWLVSIRAIFLGEVKGNFQPTRLPAEYIQWKDMLVADTVPSRTLWIPNHENYAFDSSVHPEFVAEDIFKGASVSAIISLTQSPEFIEALDQAGVKYVGVPLDIEKRIFLTDYVFDESQRNELISALEKTSLIRKSEFKELAIFENTQFHMQRHIPEEVQSQQLWANKGAALSAVTLLVLLCLLFF